MMVDENCFSKAGIEGAILILGDESSSLPRCPPQFHIY